MTKALAAALAGLAVSSAAPVLPPDDAPALPAGAVVLIECGGSARGTAFRIGAARFVSAEHVTRNGPCAIVGGPPLKTVREDAAHDIAELSGPEAGARLAIDCRGFRRGRAYFATGFAEGRDRTTTRLVATGARDPGAGGLDVLVGPVHRGMSGGPVVDRRGKAAGIVNRLVVGLPFSESRSLAGTFLCEGRGR